MAGATLVFVAGASPQIVTETVWHLARDRVDDTDVYVLTTAAGRDTIERDLLGRGGAWARLRRAHPRARAFRLPPRNVLVLRGADGRALPDVRSEADSRAVGDQIARFVATHTRPGAPPLHASIAGGRKTMGYLLATAMMVHGRPEDRLSHMLVRPPELEGTDFYFPARRAGRTLVHRRADGRVVRVPASCVDIELAELPFLRLRGLRDPATLRQGSFSALVERLQADLDALAGAQLDLVPERNALVCTGREVRLSPVRYAVYELLAERRRDGCGRADCGGCVRCFVPAADFTGAFRERLRARLAQRDSAGVSLTTWSERSFRSERSKINARLQRVLGVASTPFEIRLEGERTQRRYGLTLEPAAIRYAGEEDEQR